MAAPLRQLGLFELKLAISAAQDQQVALPPTLPRQSVEAIHCSVAASPSHLSALAAGWIPAQRLAFALATPTVAKHLSQSVELRRLA